MPDEDFKTPICSVDGVLLALAEWKLKVLLHKRPAEPFAGSWALPGGYIRTNEDDTADQAIARIMLAKTGLDVPHLEQLKTYGSADRDPRGWSVSIAYLGLCDIGKIDMDSLDDDTQFFSVDQLPDIAFDHSRIIADAVARLRGKGAYSSLPAALLPDEFTLAQLHETYQSVLGERIDASSFRRKMTASGLIEETGGMDRDNSMRPAVLYRLTGPARTINRTFGAG